MGAYRTLSLILVKRIAPSVFRTRLARLCHHLNSFGAGTQVIVVVIGIDHSGMIDKCRARSAGGTLTGGGIACETVLAFCARRVGIVEVGVRVAIGATPANSRREIRSRGAREALACLRVARHTVALFFA